MYRQPALLSRHGMDLHRSTLVGCALSAAGLVQPLLEALGRYVLRPDIGGVLGYTEFLEAIGDPKHPEHETMPKWIGRAFDLTEFNIKAMNKIFAEFKLR